WDSALFVGRDLQRAGIDDRLALGEGDIVDRQAGDPDHDKKNTENRHRLHAVNSPIGTLGQRKMLPEVAIPGVQDFGCTSIARPCSMAMRAMARSCSSVALLTGWPIWAK